MNSTNCNKLRYRLFAVAILNIASGSGKLGPTNYHGVCSYDAFAYRSHDLRCLSNYYFQVRCMVQSNFKWVSPKK